MYTGLAADYASFRPGYADSVRAALIGLLGKSPGDVDFVDVGAGTGIWTRMVYEVGVRSAVAVEPNEDMLEWGRRTSTGTGISWQRGSAEVTGLPPASADWLTMASSFHWTDSSRALAEFSRVLRPGGWFTALWNPRLVEDNPLLVEIEAYVDELRPGVKRVSSGRSGVTDTLTADLRSSGLFEDVVYLESAHEVVMSPDRYLGAWKSVNDLRVQLGPERFEAFMLFVQDKIRDLNVIHATYLTRAWAARTINGPE